MVMNKEIKINGYSLTRKWYDFARENPNKTKPVHHAIINWLIQLNNELLWVENFAVPTYHSMSVIGVSSYNTYKKAFKELVDWGFIIPITKSKNQYNPNIIALSKIDEAKQSALSIIDEAQLKQLSHNKTKQTKQTLKPKEAGKPASDNEFVSLVMNEYKKVYPLYEFIFWAKEKKAAKQLTTLWKKLNPLFTEEETLASLHDYFVKCSLIKDGYNDINMDLTWAITHYNKLIKIIEAGPKKNNNAPFVQKEKDYSIKVKR